MVNGKLVSRYYTLLCQNTGNIRAVEINSEYGWTEEEWKVINMLDVVPIAVGAAGEGAEILR